MLSCTTRPWPDRVDEIRGRRGWGHPQVSRMTESIPDPQPPSKSTVPMALFEHSARQVTEVARLCNEYIAYQHAVNEELRGRIERLERRTTLRRKRIR